MLRDRGSRMQNRVSQRKEEIESAFDRIEKAVGDFDNCGTLLCFLLLLLFVCFKKLFFSFTFFLSVLKLVFFFCFKNFGFFVCFCAECGLVCWLVFVHPVVCPPPLPPSHIHIHSPPPAPAHTHTHSLTTTEPPPPPPIRTAIPVPSHRQLDRKKH